MVGRVPSPLGPTLVPHTSGATSDGTIATHHTHNHFDLLVSSLHSPTVSLYSWGEGSGVARPVSERVSLALPTHIATPQRYLHPPTKRE